MDADLPPIALCASCQAEIRWVLTEKGNRAPMDAKPVTRGFTITKQGAVYRALNVPVFQSHFATCPHSQSWRRGERAV